jgi:hypothetical protein
MSKERGWEVDHLLDEKDFITNGFWEGHKLISSADPYLSIYI